MRLRSLAAAPSREASRPKDDLHKMWVTKGRALVEAAMALFKEKEVPKFPKIVNCLKKDLSELIASNDFPVEYDCTLGHEDD